MLVQVEHLTKTFDGFKAVDDVSFSIRRGEILGLLGPNGAGKTTTIQMVLGLITPSAGEIRIFGKNLATHREEILERTNFTCPYVSFPFRLTVLENLTVFARLYAVAEPRRKIGDLMRRFSVEHLKDKPISRLSSGENTRVGLCKAFMNDPDLLLLDEPTAGLDAAHEADVLARVRAAARVDRRAVVLAAHRPAAIAIADRVVDVAWRTQSAA